VDSTFLRGRPRGDRLSADIAPSDRVHFGAVMFARPDLLTGPRHATASLPVGTAEERPAALPLVKRYPLPHGLRRVWGAHRSGKRRLSSERMTARDAGCRASSIGYGRNLRHTTTRTRSDRCWQATLPEGGKDSHPRFRRWPWCWFTSRSKPRRWVNQPSAPRMSRPSMPSLVRMWKAVFTKLSYPRLLA
jgi:hypothetical protein